MDRDNWLPWSVLQNIWTNTVFNLNSVHPVYQYIACHSLYICLSSFDSVVHQYVLLNLTTCTKCSLLIFTQNFVEVPVLCINQNMYLVFYAPHLYWVGAFVSHLFFSWWVSSKWRKVTIILNLIELPLVKKTFIELVILDIPWFQWLKDFMNAFGKCFHAQFDFIRHWWKTSLILHIPQVAN